MPSEFFLPIQYTNAISGPLHDAPRHTGYPDFDRWVRLTDLYGRLYVRAVRAPHLLGRMRRVAAEMNRMTACSNFDL